MNYNEWNSSVFLPSCDYTTQQQLCTQISQRRPLILSPAMAAVTLSMVSYATEDILDYGIVAYAINLAYAELRGYDIQLLSPSNGNLYESRDHRWNRVKLLLELMSKNESHDYYVWFDTDLIFLDFNFRFEDLIQKYPEANIIISAERHAETGVANTGMLNLH
jgi:hypothetical protein